MLQGTKIVDNFYFYIFGWVALTGESHRLVGADGSKTLFLGVCFRADTPASGKQLYGACPAAGSITANRLNGYIVHLQGDEQRTRHAGLDLPAIVCYGYDWHDFSR